jgi:hypothetical protein
LRLCAHAGQQPVELVVAQLDRAGQELADAGLADAAEAGQLGLGGARFAHHLAEQVTTSVQALEADIRDWIEHWNESPRPFAWMKTAEEILNSLAEYLLKISGGAH